jgi:uncharacterized membrane protein
MNLTKKNLSVFLLFLLLGIMIGSLGWEVVERILHLMGARFSLTMSEPVKLLDLYVLSFSFRANIGTLLGAFGGALLFKLA